MTVDTTNFIGRSSFILPAGGAQIDVGMQDKLFVPHWRNTTLVRIDDMRSASWATATIEGDPDDAALGPDARIYVLANENIVAFNSVEEPDTEDIGVAYTGAGGLPSTEWEVSCTMPSTTRN